MAFSGVCGAGDDEGGRDGGDGDVAFVAAWVSLVFGGWVLGVGDLEVVGGLRGGIVMCRVGF